MAIGKRMILGALAALAVATAQAGGADDELRRAAKLHLGGDTAQAVSLWQGLAAKGNVSAAYNLAVIHHAGDGVARDYGEAMKWYRVAAERGDRVSQYQVGLMYQRGEGVAVDEAEAHRWFVMNRAAHQHHAHGELPTALATAAGKSTPN